MMLHPDLFTNYLQNFQIFQEILIPTLSCSFNSDDRSFQLIAYRHKRFLQLINEEVNQTQANNLTNIQPNDSNISPPNTKQASFNINLKKIPTIDSIKSLVSFVSQSVPLPLKFFKNYVPSLSPIEERIFQIFDTYSNSLEFLFYCYLWGVATGNIELLLKTAYSSFLLSINDNHNQKVKSVKYDQDFFSSFRSEPTFSISIDRRTGFVNLNDHLLRSHYQKSIFCVMNDHIFLMGSNSILTNISLSELVTDREKRFTTAKFEMTQSRNPPAVCISNGYLLVCGDVPQIYNVDPFQLLKNNPSYSPKNSPHVKSPLTSDDYYIYSLASKSEITVFTIEKAKIAYIRTVKLRVGNSPLLIPYSEKLVSKKWLKNATTVTDGFTFRIILADGEPGRVQHFIRSFSLIDGVHLGDQKVVYQFLIHSISYDPYSRSYYVLTPFSEGSQILRFENISSQPPWIADISLASFPINQTLQKVFDQSYVRPITLSIAIFTILQYFTIPLMGCEPCSPSVNQNVLNYLAPSSKPAQIIKMVLESIAAMNTSVSPFPFELKSESIENSMKTLLILLSINISRHEHPLNFEESQKITSILPIILTKNRSYRSTVFFLLVDNFEKLFRNCPETISDSFAFFLSDLSAHELMMLNNLSRSTLFPYLFSEKMYPMFYTTRIQRIRKTTNQIEPNELTFILRFQHSLFTHDEKDPAILKYCSALASGMFEQMIFMLKDLNDIEFFNSNTFIHIYRKFLLLIQLKLSNFVLINELIKFVQPLMISFTECLNKFKIVNITSSSLYQCFIESFEMCISFFNGIINSKSDISKANKYIHIIQSINHFLMNNETEKAIVNDDKIDLNLNLNELFNTKFSKYQQNIESFMDFYYESIKNPMNKNISKDEKIFEGQFVLVLANLLKIDLPKDEINEQIKKLVQTVYKIRTNLRSSKQMTIQKSADSLPSEKITDQYPQYLNQVKEKVAFLTYINSDFLNEPIQLNEISGYISTDMSLLDFFNISKQIHSSCTRFQFIFKPFLEMIKIPNFPIHFYSRLFQQIANNKYFLEVLDVISLLNKNNDLQEILLQLVKYIVSLDSETQIPIPSFLSFSTLMILIFSKNKRSHDKIYYTIYLLFDFVCKNAEKMKIIKETEIKNEKENSSENQKGNKDSVKSKNKNETHKKITNGTKNKSESKNTNETKNKSESKNTNETKNKSESKNTNETRNKSESKNTNETRNKSESKNTNETKNKSESKNTNETKNKSESKNTNKKDNSIESRNKNENIVSNENDTDNINGGDDNKADKCDNDDINCTKMFNSCFTFLCYFLRTLFDTNVIEYNEDEMNKIEACFQSIPLPFSFNFMISHSMIHAGFKPKQQLGNILALIDTIQVQDFHSYCLLLYEYFIQEEGAIQESALLLLDNIGSILTGCNTTLLSESLNITDIYSIIKSDTKLITTNNCIKTPEAQFNLVYELIILFRRILLTETKASKSIKNLFSEIMNNFVNSSQNEILIKQLISVCSIISNTFNSFTPFSFINNKKTNEKFFISDIFNQWLIGVSLPITGILNFAFISIENIEIEPLYFLKYKHSMFYDKEAELNLYHYVLNSSMNSYSSSLVSFFVLNCLRERILDQERGEPFSHEFIQDLEQFKVEGFEYRMINNQVISLIQKHLINPEEGVFKPSLVNPSFHHCSFAQLTLEDDYSITKTHLISKKATNFFITDLLDLNKPISFAVMVGPRQFPYIFFGFIAHSLKLNHCFSILYNSTERGVLINGQESIIFENMKQIIEFRFDPIKKKIFLTSTNNKCKPIIEMDLNVLHCSFVAVLPEMSQIEYYLGPTTQTPCSKKEEEEEPNDNSSLFNVKFNRDDDSEESIEKVETFRMFKPKLVYSNDDHDVEELDDNTYYAINDDIVNASKSKSILQPMVGSNDKITDFFQFKTIQSLATIMPISIGKDVLFYSSKNPNIWSSSTNINNTFLSIDKFDGYFKLTTFESSEISILKAIKPFFYENLIHIPTDLINSYISGLSSIHCCELITQLVIRAISDKKIPIDKTISLFQLDSSFFLNFIIKMLVIIEPFNAFNIKEGKSPIDFEFNSIVSRCTKTKYLNYHAAVCKILKSDIINNKKEFFNFWFKRLLVDINNKSMHFVTKDNPDYIIIQRGLKQETKEISIKDSIGYLLFPTQFGLRKMPKIQTLNDINVDNETDNYSEKVESKNKDEFVTYSFIEGNKITITNLENKFVLLPIFQSNSSLINSFIELVINFKYFVFFLNDCISSNLFNHSEILAAKIELRKQVYCAITSGSPFFYTHDNVLLKFLNDHLPLSVSEFTEDYVQILNVFSLTSHTIPHPSISNFIQEQSLLFDDHKAEAYCWYFPEFCDPSDNNHTFNEGEKKGEFKMPQITLPTVLNRFDPSTRAALLSLKRILQPRDSIVNFPFHLVINEWAYFYSIFPPADIRIDTPCSLSITFTRYVPDAIRVFDRDVELVDTAIEYSYSPFFADPQPGSLLEPIPLSGDFITVKFKITENVSQHNFIVTTALLSSNGNVPNTLIDPTKNSKLKSTHKKQPNSPPSPTKPTHIVKSDQNNNSSTGNNCGFLLNLSQIDLTSVVVHNRDVFVSDMREMILQWTKRDDQQILVHIKPEFFYRNNISPHIDPLDLASLQSTSSSLSIGSSSPPHSTHLVALRSMLLIDFNWLCAQYKEVASDDSSFHVFRPFISMLLSARNFRQLVENESNNDTNYANLRINRRAGLEVRSGVSKRLDQSMIAQFATQYRNPSRFRSIKRPFHIEYVGENGIDVGGLARDFASELAKDICEFRVGLFVATPNARNKIGSFRECLVPAPDPRIKEPGKLYRAVGGLIAIGVRSGIVQPFNFPPFFWHYLAGEKITIESIYEVDEVFRKSIEGLESAIEKGTQPQQFDKAFARTKASFIDFRGNEVNILNANNNVNNISDRFDVYNVTNNNINDGFGGYYQKPSSSLYITHSNASRFITESHEFRVRELEVPMRSICDGFWENLNFKRPPYVSAELLEFIVCGERQVDLRQLRVVTQFTAVPKEEITMFWAALGRMNSEQRRNLLQFATGSMCIPQNSGPFFLTIEYVDAPVDKRLPAAATCFNRIHLPPYSSVEKMLQALITAIEYTGTFENS